MTETPPRLSNVVRFELPAYVDVDEFGARIRERWPGTIQLKGDIWVVSARVKSTADDLAHLLRRVETYVADTDLQAIRYCLDGRYYVMEARAPDRAAAA